MVIFQRFEYSSVPPIFATLAANSNGGIWRNILKCSLIWCIFSSNSSSGWIHFLKLCFYYVLKNVNMRKKKCMQSQCLLQLNSITSASLAITWHLIVWQFVCPSDEVHNVPKSKEIVFITRKIQRFSWKVSAKMFLIRHVRKVHRNINQTEWTHPCQVASREFSDRYTGMQNIHTKFTMQILNKIAFTGNLIRSSLQSSFKLAPEEIPKAISNAKTTKECLNSLAEDTLTDDIILLTFRALYKLQQNEK